MTKIEKISRPIAVAQKLLKVHIVSAAYCMENGGTNIRTISADELTRFKNLLTPLPALIDTGITLDPTKRDAGITIRHIGYTRLEGAESALFVSSGDTAQPSRYETTPNLIGCSALVVYDRVDFNDQKVNQIIDRLGENNDIAVFEGRPAQIRADPDPIIRADRRPMYAAFIVPDPELSIMIARAKAICNEIDRKLAS